MLLCCGTKSCRDEILRNVRRHHWPARRSARNFSFVVGDQLFQWSSRSRGTSELRSDWIREHLDLISRERSTQIRQRPPRLKDDGSVFVNIVHQKNPAAESRQRLFHGLPVEVRALC